ncbi:hypothetical protein HID58_048497 [Brassica napus]|uniref:Uncharacterized protein n=1 Tax=Brassica napus TaxID=3708 RepID=A0ABQ8B297_BRANA|nr:hypothetical protein HID58_048497 [Brassica napus]
MRNSQISRSKALNKSSTKAPTISTSASMSKNPAKSPLKLQLNRPPVPWIRKKGLLGSIYSFESCKKKDPHREHSSESCLSVLQEHSLAIEFNWFWFHSCEEFEAISMIKIQSMVTKLRSKRKGSPYRMTAFYVETSLLKRVLGYCNTSLQLQRKEMSYNNYLGVDSAWNCVSDSENPTCAVMKHTNPCGEAYQIAVIADPGSTFGGIVAANVKVDKASHESHNRFNESLATLAVALVTAVNTKRIGDGELIVFSGVEMYLAKISVYDNVVKATFVLLGNTGPELTGRQALELIDNYFEANGDIGANHEMPTPQCLVEVSSSNLTVKRQTISVTKVVSPAVLPPFVVAESQPDAIDEESTCSSINSFLS